MIVEYVYVRRRVGEYAILNEPLIEGDVLIEIRLTEFDEASCRFVTWGTIREMMGPDDGAK